MLESSILLQATQTQLDYHIPISILNPASKKLNIVNTKNPNSVVELLTTHGLTQTHVKSLITSRPVLLLADLDNTLKPNLELFESLGFSSTSLGKMLSKYPRVLESDAYTVVEFFRAHGFSDQQISDLTMKRPTLYLFNAHKNFKPKLEFFRSLGFEIVDEVMKLGFDPNNPLFVLAIRSMAVMSKSLWEQKVEAFKSFGLSKDEIYAAFKKQPMCMITSENKIRKLMSFFVNKLNMTPSMISKNPNLLLLSLEKRIIPRCSVLHLLISKGLVKEETSVVYVFRMTEKRFVDKLVSKYQNEVPDVVSAHQGKIEFQGFPFDLKI
ncbi:transcription termination factor mterf5 [Quercus suber]|uniref:Transcription termination factor mterf5 n=1 Tax=Quercus suber TaxID=58331 RepID=A0AAW0IR24_QUESU